MINSNLLDQPLCPGQVTAFGCIRMALAIHRIEKICLRYVSWRASTWLSTLGVSRRSSKGAVRICVFEKDVFFERINSLSICVTHDNVHRAGEIRIKVPILVRGYQSGNRNFRYATLRSSSKAMLNESDAVHLSMIFRRTICFEAPEPQDWRIRLIRLLT